LLRPVRGRTLVKMRTPVAAPFEHADPMGPELLDQHVQTLRSRANRYRKIGALLGESAAAAKLAELASELDGAIETLGRARKTIGATVESSHELWAALNLKALTPLKTHNASGASNDGQTAADWRSLSKLWIEEAESCRDHPDKELLAARAFEIAQLAERLATDAGAP